MKVTKKYGNTFYTFDCSDDSDFFSGLWFIFKLCILLAIACGSCWLLDTFVM